MLMQRKDSKSETRNGQQANHSMSSPSHSHIGPHEHGKHNCARLIMQLSKSYYWRSLASRGARLGTIGQRSPRRSPSDGALFFRKDCFPSSAVVSVMMLSNNPRGSEDGYQLSIVIPSERGHGRGCGPGPSWGLGSRYEGTGQRQRQLAVRSRPPLRAVAISQTVWGGVPSHETASGNLRAAASSASGRSQLFAANNVSPM